jgi:hypothetical protein
MTARLPLMLLSIALVLGACSRKPDEQRIRETIAAMQTAMETRQPRDFMAHIASDFTGNDGSVDREGLHNVLRGVALQNEKLGVTLGPIDIDLRGDRATADLIATFTGGSGGMLPERGAVYSIHSAWRREGSDWRCYNGTWEQKL